jgi:hypothetical protein
MRDALNMPEEIKERGVNYCVSIPQSEMIAAKHGGLTNFSEVVRVALIPYIKRGKLLDKMLAEEQSKTPEPELPPIKERMLL